MDLKIAEHEKDKSEDLNIFGKELRRFIDELAKLAKELVKELKKC